MFGFHLLLFFFFSRQWPRLNVPPALEAIGLTIELPTIVRVKGSLVGCKGLLIMLKIKVENNQVLKRTLHLKLQLSVVSINKDFCI